MLGSDGRFHLVAEGFLLPRRMPELPPAREFLTSAGFGGAAVLAAAIILAAVAALAGRRASNRHRRELEQQDRHHRQRREDEQRAVAVTRCWQRLVWVVETASIEPAASEGATLGVGPELALELLRGLLQDAEQLGDGTLVKAASVYLGQFSLVLAQQGSLLSEFVAASSSPADLQTDERAAIDGPPGPSVVAEELSETAWPIGPEGWHG
jgi:hypothetical protein